MNKSIHLSLIVFSLLVCGYLGYDMVQRGEQELLWGYRPLFCFLAGWSAVVLTVKWFSKRDSWRGLGLSTASGLLLGIGFPEIIPVPFLMLIGFVPLLLLEQELSDEYGKPARWRLFRYTYHTFVVWNVVATYWVANTAFAAGIFAIWVNALLMCIPWLLFHTTRFVMPGLKYAALVAYWLLFEYIHLNWDLTWPWLTLGNSFAEFPSLVQWYSITGVFGGSLLILLANVLGLRIWQAHLALESYRKPLLQLLALVLIPSIASLAIYFSYENKGESREVVVVQPNFEPHYVKFNMSESMQLEQFLKLTKQAVTPETDYVVYPETSFGFVEDQNINGNKNVQLIREALTDYPGLKVVTGVNAYHIFKNGEPHSKAVRQRVRGGGKDTMYYEILNAAIQLDMGTDEVQLYRKSKLVPGPEIFPFKELLFFMEPLVDRLDGTTAGLGTQDAPSVLSSVSGNIAPAICYESIFGEYVTGYVRQGAQAIFIMTNDGWWDNTAGHRQHLHFASLRAIETRRSIARSANTGVSAFINQRGDILQATQYDEAAAISREILFNDRITFYTRWGDLIARIALFGSILLLLNTLVQTFVPKER
jgi:apolipoprotein N-acyltransferase